METGREVGKKSLVILSVIFPIFFELRYLLVLRTFVVVNNV